MANVLVNNYFKVTRNGKCSNIHKISTTDQANNGFSLQSQEKECKHFAEIEGLTVIQIFVEHGESAKTIQRTTFQTMIKYCIENKKM